MMATTTLSRGLVLACCITMIAVCINFTLRLTQNRETQTCPQSRNILYINGNGNEQQLLIPKLVINDMWSEVHYNLPHEEYIATLQSEYNSGQRDKYYLPQTYQMRANNEHFDDRQFKDSWQKEVYVFARNVMRHNALNTVLDVGCGSGYKLVKYLAASNFTTYGFETEPAISYLRETYPNQNWVDSGKESESFNDDEENTVHELQHNVTDCLVLSSDVIEHIRDPDGLLEFMLSFVHCRLFVISTPNRDMFHNRFKPGPPSNLAHVREWTFAEFYMYLNSRGFNVIASYHGIQHPTTMFHLCTRKLSQSD